MMKWKERVVWGELWQSVALVGAVEGMTVHLKAVKPEVEEVWGMRAREEDQNFQKRRTLMRVMKTQNMVLVLKAVQEEAGVGVGVDLVGVVVDLVAVARVDLVEEEMMKMEEATITGNLIIGKITLDESDADCALVQNTVERHNHSLHYCMRKDKCRFKYKRPLRSNTVIVFTERKDKRVRAHIHAATNDGWLNRNNKTATQYWRANTDLSVLVDVGEVLDYMVSYVSKVEKPTPYGNKLLYEILSNAGYDHPAATIFRKIFMKLKPDRDIGKQEITHRLLKLP